MVRQRIFWGIVLGLVMPGLAGAQALDAPPAAPAESGPTPAAQPAPEEKANSGAQDAPAPLARFTRPGRIVVMPVVVANGPVPDATLLAALSDGLAVNANWRVQLGLGDADVDRTLPDDLETSTLTGFEARLSMLGKSAESLFALEILRDEIEDAARMQALGPKARALYLRVVDSLVQAALASGDQARAKAAADRATLLLPGVRDFSALNLSVVTTALLSTARPEVFARLDLGSRPTDCALDVNDVPVGKAPVSILVAPTMTYIVRATCALAGTTRRRVVASAAGKARVEIMDAEFERALVTDARGTRLQFVSPAERKEMEQVYARRLADKLNADSVVFVSLGEVGESEYLNARFYLRSGFRNRQGLARPEAARAESLGRYLASGVNPSGDVLGAEEASKLALADVAIPQDVRGKSTRAPWYTDSVGWALVGTGLLAVGAGYYVDTLATRKRQQATQAGRNDDPFARDRLQGDASLLDYISGIGIFGGSLMLATGVVLLITPEYESSKSELFVLAPSYLPSGGGLLATGRF